MDLGPLIASVVTSVGIVAAGYATARRFQKIGGNDAQERLNKIRADLDDAMTEKVRVLEDQFLACKRRLGEVEDQMKAWRRERIDLKQEIDDLHDDLRTMRAERKERGA